MLANHANLYHVYISFFWFREQDVGSHCASSWSLLNPFFFNKQTRFVTVMYRYLSLVVRKPVFCICENKNADQLRGNREADQRLCFRFSDSTIPLLPKYEISGLQSSSVAVQPGLCGTWSETSKTSFLRTRLI